MIYGSIRSYVKAELAKNLLDLTTVTDLHMGSLNSHRL